MDRIATFKSFIDRNPKDPFPRYGLAMEHKTRGELDLAWAEFENLLSGFTDYVPTYLMAGGTLAAMGRPEDAADLFRRGITVARQKGDSHAAGELESALAEVEANAGHEARSQ